MFDFGRITLFYLGYRFSKHKMTICSKNFGGAKAPRPPGYAYGGSTAPANKTKERFLVPGELSRLLNFSVNCLNRRLTFLTLAKLEVQ